MIRVKLLAALRVAGKDFVPEKTDKSGAIIQEAQGSFRDYPPGAEPYLDEVIAERLIRQGKAWRYV